MNKTKMTTILLSAFLVLTACQTQDDIPSDDTDNTEETTGQMQDETEATDENEATEEDSETDGIEAHEFDISLEDAVNTFQDEYGKMEIYAVELTTEDGEYQYEIKGSKDNIEYKVHIHADSGDVLSEKEEDDDGNHMEIDFERIITPKEAMDNALEEVDSGAYVTSWELEEEDGGMSYEVEYEFEETGKDDGDITVDAYSGDITEK